MVCKALNCDVCLLIRSRVEKYRPDTLDDVEGHRDIIATINKFVDSNVRVNTSI